MVRASDTILSLTRMIASIGDMKVENVRIATVRDSWINLEPKRRLDISGIENDDTILVSEVAVGCLALEDALLEL